MFGSAPGVPSDTVIGRGPNSLNQDTAKSVVPRLYRRRVLDALFRRFPLVCPGCGRRGDPVCDRCCGRAPRGAAGPGSARTRRVVGGVRLRGRGPRGGRPGEVPRRPGRGAVAGRRDGRRDGRRARCGARGRRRHLGAHQPRPTAGARLRPGRAPGPGRRPPAHRPPRRSLPRAARPPTRDHRRPVSPAPTVAGVRATSHGARRRGRCSWSTTSPPPEPRWPRRRSPCSAAGAHRWSRSPRPGRHHPEHWHPRHWHPDTGIVAVVDFARSRPRTEEVRWTSWSAARTGRCRPDSTRWRARRCRASPSSRTTPGGSRSTSPSSSIAARPSRSCARSPST